MRLVWLAVLAVFCAVMLAIQPNPTVPQCVAYRYVPGIGTVTVEVAGHTLKQLEVTNCR